MSNYPIQTVGDVDAILERYRMLLRNEKRLLNQGIMPDYASHLPAPRTIARPIPVPPSTYIAEPVSPVVHCQQSGGNRPKSPCVCLEETTAMAERASTQSPSSRAPVAGQSRPVTPPILRQARALAALGHDAAPGSLHSAAPPPMPNTFPVKLRSLANSRLPSETGTRFSEHPPPPPPLASHGPPPPELPNIPYLKPPPRQRPRARKYHNERLGMSISKYISGHPQHGDILDAEEDPDPTVPVDDIAMAVPHPALVTRDPEDAKTKKYAGIAELAKANGTELTEPGAAPLKTHYQPLDMPMPSSLDPAGFLAFVRRQQCQRETAGPATGSASESNHQWVDIEFLASPMDRMRKAATAASMSPGSPSDALGRSSRETGGPLQPVLSPGTASCQNPMVLADADDGEEWFHAVTSEAHSATVDDLDAFTDHLAPPPSGPQIWRPPLLVSRSRRSSAIPTTSPFSLYESTIDPTSPSTPRQQLSSPVSVATMLPEIVRPPASPVRSMASTPLPQRHFQLRSPAVDTVVSFEEVCRRYVTSAIASTQQAGAPKPDEQGNDPGAVGAPRSRRATHTGAILVMSPSLVPAQSSESSQQLAELAPLPETLIPIAGALAGTLRMRASTMPPLRLAVLTSALKSSGVSPLASPASQGLGSADSDAVRARPVSSSDALEVSRRVSLQMPAAGTATSYNNGSPDKAPSVRDLAGGTFTNDGGLEGTRGGITSMGSAIQVTRAVAILSRSRRGGGGRAQSIESTSSGAGGASSSQLVSRRSIGSMASDSLNELHGEGDEGKEYSTIDDTAEDGEYSADRLTGGLGTVLGTSNTQSTGGTGDSSHHPNMGTGHTLSSGYDYFGTTDYLGDSPIVQVLDWPGHVELHPLHFPTESELYDSEGTLLELACFRNVDMANIHDPSLPSADVCWDIWRLMDDQKAPFSVVLFWLAKAGRTDEAMARINSELVSTASAALLYLGAQLRMLQGRHDEAIHDLEDVLYKDRTLPEAWALKGRMHQIYGPSRLCVNAFTHALKLIPGPTAWRVYFERGCVHEATKEPMYAFEDFKMVRMLQPECSEAIWRHAHYYLDKELYEDALSTIQVILDRKPGNAQALYLRGLALSQLTNWSRALDDFTAAIRIEPNAPAPYVHRGCLARICAPKKTIEDLSVALLLDENNVDALLHRGHVYYEMERFDLAHCDWNRVTELHASAHIHLNLGILSMHHLDDYVQAMHHLDAAVDLDPVLATTYLARAELCQRLHQESFMMSGSIIRRLRKRSGASSAEVNFLERANREYSRVIRLYPTNYIFYLHRGRLLLRQKKTALAMLDFHTAFELNSGIAQTFLQRSLILSFQGKYSQVIKEYNEQRALGVRFEDNLLVLVAKAHMRSGDARAALVILSESPRMTSEPQIHVHRGLCYQSLKQHTQAIQEYTKCVVLSPRFAKAYFHRGVCRMLLGEARTGLDDINEALRQDSKMYEAYLIRASYFEKEGRYLDGIDDCTSAIRLEPAATRGYLKRGLLRCHVQQYGAALGDFTRVTEIDRDNLKAYLNRAITHHHAGDSNAALRDYSIVLLLASDTSARVRKEAESKSRPVSAPGHRPITASGRRGEIRFDPSRVQLALTAHRQRGFLHWQRGEYEQAVADLQVAATGCPGDMALHEVLGMSLFKVQQPEAAIAVFARMIQEHPEHITGYLARGSVYSQISQLKLAVRDFSHCLHLQPNCVDAYVNLGSATQRMGFMRRAWDHFTAALALDPSSAVALQGRASIHLARNDSFAALLDMTSAVNHMPDSARAMVNRGAVHQTMGDHVAALRDYKSAMALEPTMALAHFNAGNLYFGQQSWARAKACYDAAIALATHDFPALVNRGLTKIELGEFDDALEDLLLARQFAHSHFEIARVCYQLAGLSQKMGRIEDAELYLNSALQHMPQSIDAWIKRAEVRGQLGKMTGALQDYAHALTLDNKLESISPSIFARKSRA